MKLSEINTGIGHWHVLKGYPGSIVPGVGTTSKSPLLYPEQRKKAPITRGGKFGQKKNNNKNT